MGYQTSYKLTVSIYGNYYPDIIEELRDNCSGAHHALSKGGETNDSVKWYSHEEDMRTFSKLHPNALFVLEGEGEEMPDLWIKYFQNGKMQECKAIITYPDFSPLQLK